MTSGACVAKLGLEDAEVEGARLSAGFHPGVSVCRTGLCVTGVYVTGLCGTGECGTGVCGTGVCSTRPGA